MHTKQQTVSQAEQDQSSATSVSQPDLHRKMLARVKESDGDDDKLLTEYQQDIESDQPRKFRQELKDRVADPLQVHLHAERARYVIALGDQLSADNRVCERMRVQIAYTCVTLDEANARADIATSTTQLTRGKLRPSAKVAAKMKQSYLWRLKKCDVRIKSLEARDIQLEAPAAARECLPKLVVRLKHASIDDDADDERDGEVVLDACVYSHRTASPGASTLRRRTVHDVLSDSRDKENILYTCCAPLFHSRLFDDG